MIDENIRGEWAFRVRTKKTMTLGQHCQDLEGFAKGLWMHAPPEPPEVKGSGKVAPKNMPNAKEPAKGSGGKKGNGKMNKSAVDSDNNKLCAFYNSNGCNNSNCKYTHKCNFLINGQPCRGNHPASGPQHKG